MDHQEKETGLTGTQKTGFVLLLIFGFMTIGLGMLQMRNNIYNPFSVRLTEADDLQNLFENQDMVLQSIDTDHDGLNDWEELNFYETSPYLSDTDSDGLDDKVEIDQGADPLCPAGADCSIYQGELPTPPEEIIVSPLQDGSNTPFDILSDAGLVEEEGGDMTAVLSSLQDPEKLREMLLGTGTIGKEQLDEIDDKTLLSLVQEMMSAQGETVDLITTTSTNLQEILP